jgi:quercetin dioxygenase-like cupin family protein
MTNFIDGCSRRELLTSAAGAAAVGLSTRLVSANTSQGDAAPPTEVQEDLSALVGFETLQVSNWLHDRPSGERLRLVYGSGGEFRADYRVAAGGYIPFEHIHFNQAEVFDVRAGEFELNIDGKVQRAKAGQVVRVPAGSRHIGRNPGDQEVQIVVAFEPSLDANRLFERTWMLCEQGHVDATGRPHLVRVLEATCDLDAVTYDSRFPRPVQDAARAFGRRLKALGMTGWPTF